MGALRGRMNNPSNRQLLLFLFLGCGLAALCVVAGSVLTPPALARWDTQTHENDHFRAALAIIGIRHLPIFLLSIAIGNAVFTWQKDAKPQAVLALFAPYLVYLVGTAIAESLELGEPAFSWVGYEPRYFVWPHFVCVPAGLMASHRMVRQRNRSSR